LYIGLAHCLSLEVGAPAAKCETTSQIVERNDSELGFESRTGLHPGADINTSNQFDCNPLELAGDADRVRAQESNSNQGPMERDLHSLFDPLMTVENQQAVIADRSRLAQNDIIGQAYSSIYNTDTFSVDESGVRQGQDPLSSVANEAAGHSALTSSSSVRQEVALHHGQLKKKLKFGNSKIMKIVSNSSMFASKWQNVRH
jgi:hypothetical protein